MVTPPSDKVTLSLVRLGNRLLPPSSACHLSEGRIVFPQLDPCFFFSPSSFPHSRAGGQCFNFHPYRFPIPRPEDNVVASAQLALGEQRSSSVTVLQPAPDDATPGELHAAMEGYDP